MKNKLTIIMLVGIVSLLTTNAFSQTCTFLQPCCSSTGINPPTPSDVPDANIVLRTMSGGTVTQILPNTQYRLSITQPAGSSNSYVRVYPNEGFGFLENATGFAEDLGPGQTVNRTITSDSFGGVIVITVRGGSGGGAYKLCLSAGTRDVFPE